MKEVLISIQPQHVDKICDVIHFKNRKPIYKKTIEVRKDRPKKVKTPFKCLIYETKAKYKKGIGVYFYGIELQGTAQGCGKVIGEFICDYIEEYEYDPQFGYYTDGYYSSQDDLPSMCLTQKDLINYGKGKTLFGWHISNLVIYDTPKELGEFRKPCDWNFDCCTCKRAKYELTKAEAKVFYGCDRELTRPFQSWGYVEG